MDYVIVDGKNMAYRVGWTHKMLSYNGKPTGVLYGFMNSLMKIMQKYPNDYVAIAWDGRPDKRIRLSEEAVKAGLIDMPYKANRVTSTSPEWEAMHNQMPELYEMLGAVGVKQVKMDNEEADDIVATWTNRILAKGEKVTIVSSDKDFYQLLLPNVTLWDAMNDKYMTETKLMTEYGLEPHQWIDMGALMGDSGDAIQGIPGWGEKTALKYIRENYSWEKVLEVIEKKEKRSKREEDLITYKARLQLAYTLKKMDKDVVGCPELDEITWFNELMLKMLFSKYGFQSMNNKMNWFKAQPRTM